jgi:hypothetical protein
MVSGSDRAWSDERMQSWLLVRVKLLSVVGHMNARHFRVEWGSLGKEGTNATTCNNDTKVVLSGILPQRTF